MIKNAFYAVMGVAAILMPKIGKRYNIPIEVIGLPILSILFVHHVLTLPDHVSMDNKVSKYIGTIGIVLLTFTTLFNHFLVKFFTFNIYMIPISILPAMIYSLIRSLMYEFRKNRT